MTDLIKREDAIKAVENVSENYTKEGDREWHPHIDFITQALVQVPSVSPKPKQGEWIYCEDDEGQDGYRCSECGFFVPWYYGYEDINYIYKYHACPSCMARMKGADNE